MWIASLMLTAMPATLILILTCALTFKEVSVIAQGYPACGPPKLLWQQWGAELLVQALRYRQYQVKQHGINWTTYKGPIPGVKPWSIYRVVTAPWIERCFYQMTALWVRHDRCVFRSNQSPATLKCCSEQDRRIVRWKRIQARVFWGNPPKSYSDSTWASLTYKGTCSRPLSCSKGHAWEVLWSTSTRAEILTPFSLYFDSSCCLVAFSK